MISIIIPVRNASGTLTRCLESVMAQDLHHECIVVDDGSTDDSLDIARSYPVRLVELRGGPFGPAYARNRGAELARGDLLYFVDADVVLLPRTLNTLAATFERTPQPAAVFGSYDDRPGADNFLSRFRNLLHHYVHQHAHTDAATFWSACGAVRRGLFLAAGGFNDVRYTRPCVEDIELGYRLRAGGHRIIIDKLLQVKHLKRWTLRGMIQTDVFDRAIPWTQLILLQRKMPNDLNLHVSSRISAVLLIIMLMYVAIMPAALSGANALTMAVPPLVLAAATVLLNWRLYAFFVSKQGWMFALAAVPVHWLYYLYSAAGFIAGTALHLHGGFHTHRILAERARDR